MQILISYGFESAHYQMYTVDYNQVIALICASLFVFAHLFSLPIFVSRDTQN